MPSLSSVRPENAPVLKDSERIKTFRQTLEREQNVVFQTSSSAGGFLVQDSNEVPGDATVVSLPTLQAEPEFMTSLVDAIISAYKTNVTDSAVVDWETAFSEKRGTGHRPQGKELLDVRTRAKNWRLMER